MHYSAVRLESIDIFKFKLFLFDLFIYYSS